MCSFNRSGWVAAAAAAGGILAGCASGPVASVEAPLDLVETPGLNNPTARVLSVERLRFENDANVNAGLVATVGYVGAVAVSGFANRNQSSGSSTGARYIHTIQYANGESERQSSQYEFAVGSCVSIGPQNSRFISVIARSKRC